jgi:hypothetical protein
MAGDTEVTPRHLDSCIIAKALIDADYSSKVGLSEVNLLAGTMQA